MERILRVNALSRSFLETGDLIGLHSELLSETTHDTGHDGTSWLD
jgi:hypothetical protein